MNHSNFFNVPVAADVSSLPKTNPSSSAPTAEKDGPLTHLSFRVSCLEVSLSQTRVLLQGLMEQQNALMMTMDHLIKRDDDEYWPN